LQDCVSARTAYTLRNNSVSSLAWELAGDIKPENCQTMIPR
jgi:hypothetical protein